MTPRPAKPSDLPAVIDLTRRAYGHYVPLIGRLPVPMSEDYAPRIGKGEVWLCEDADDLIGLLVLEDRGDRSLIFSVAVSPERQGAGVGRDLLRFAEVTARNRGHRRLALYTNARMERNIRIYSSFGYRETGREPHPKLPGSTIVHMEKSLSEQSKQA